MRTKKKPAEMTATEVAAKINAHLKRFEKDPKINVDRSPTKAGLHDYYQAVAFRSGSRVGVLYIAYQGTHHLTPDEARAYLAWLDAGNVGKHFEQQREAQAQRGAQ